MKPTDPSADGARSLRLLPWHRIFLIGVTVITAGLVGYQATPGGRLAPAEMARVHPRRAADMAVADASPVFRQGWVTPPGHTTSAHGSTVCALPSGDLLVGWYGGSREGAGDVALFTSRLAAGAREWTPPRTAVDRALAASELERQVKKVGNAVIFPDLSGTLWMVYVSVALGGWSGSTLNVKTSLDEGRTWGESRRLTLNPFLNLSSLVRSKPIHTRDGRIGLPVYHELALKFPQMLWLTPGAGGVLRDYHVRNLSVETGLIQPTLVALDDDRVLMLLRDRGRSGRRLHTAYSSDNGWTWEEAEASTLTNPDAAVDALRLRDGRVLLVYNQGERERDVLRLAISADAGRTWQPGPVIEAEAGREFSYPCLAEDQRGRIHLTYTWQRERIKHVEFNLAWLNGPVVAREERTP
jgi:predicted neuraminidase